MASTMQRSWHGDELGARINRATGRAIIGIATAAANETKRVTHVGESGNLRRSVHVALPGYDGSGDELEAPASDLLMDKLPKQAAPTPLGPAVEMGSWMPYACAEWVGRSHPGVTQGLEAVRGHTATQIVVAAFRAEGL